MAILQANATTGRIVELNRLLVKARAERDEKDVIVRWLEQQMAEAIRKPGAVLPPEDLIAATANAVAQLSELQATLSVRQLSAAILAAQPEGLTIPALLLELRKRGFQSASDNPANIVNSILNRASRPFRKMGDRWFHERFFQQEPNGPATPTATPAEVGSPSATTKTAS
ncbi:MAG TPA: hypothetical protein VNU74_08810 [Terriglobales bacterium]|jgi:hypothetical protein|nr:hypothetical protein [Terriglobales bacterium]